MNTRKLLLYLSVVLLGGCVPVISLYPLYTDKDVVFEEKLLGTWAQDNDETTWQFKRADEPENAYKLIFTDNEGKKGSFIVRLVKLQNKHFLDVYPAEMPCDVEDPNKAEWPHNVFFLIPAHTFLKIDSMEPQLKIRLILEPQVEELLEQEPNAIKHAVIEDRVILTAPTKELQAFVLKYADGDKLFTDEIVLGRKTP